MENPEEETMANEINDPEVDLFAGGSDYEDDVYRANEVTGGSIPVDIANEIKKPARKGNLLSLENFWHNTANNLLEAPTTRKNVLWDFMVFHNLREERQGRYMASAQQLEAEALNAIKKAKVEILRDVSDNAHVGLFVNEVAAAFDHQVMKLVGRYRVKAMDGSPLYSKTTPNVESVERKVAIEAYLKSNSDFIKLRTKLASFRAAKNSLVSSSLTRLLSSIEGMRNRVVSEIYEANSSSYRRVTLTRFLRQMDKISNRSEFSGEYRFDLLKTFIKNKDALETYIQNSATFGDITTEIEHFEDFNNTFTPDKEESDIAYDMDYTDYQDMDVTEDRSSKEPASHDHMMDFMNATPPDDILGSQSTDDPYGTQEVPNSTMSGDNAMQTSDPIEVDLHASSAQEVQAPDKEEEETQLKLLEEARKKAAEILRLKRLNRASASNK